MTRLIGYKFKDDSTSDMIQHLKQFELRPENVRCRGLTVYILPLYFVPRKQRQNMVIKICTIRIYYITKHIRC